MPFEWPFGLRRQPDISLIHEFQRPPYGGGNQFLIGLRKEFERRGLRVETNHISANSHACLFNSFNFDFDKLRSWRRPSCRMVHRVDGPIAAYRGRDDGTDGKIFLINQELADATVFQSHYSLAAHKAAGLELLNPVVITNAADPALFYAGPPRQLGRKIKLISTSWSDNPNKGGGIYDWLDRHLDWNRFEYTFAGRSSVAFKNIRMVPALPSFELGQLLREHDIYITASANDPCSNALIEGLTCGLPAIYLQSGGHPELVGAAGFGFTTGQEALEAIDRLVEEYDARRQRISIPTLSEVTDRYLSVMGIDT